MDPNQSRLPGSPGDPGSHLQFQISLLRLMEQKWTGRRMTDQKALGQKVPHQKTGSAAGPAVELEELERLQHSWPV
jgi:hypothetical protein